MLDGLPTEPGALYATAFGGSTPILSGATRQGASVSSPSGFTFRTLSPDTMRLLSAPPSDVPLMAAAQHAFARAVDAVTDFDQAMNAGQDDAGDDDREGGATIAGGLALAARLLAADAGTQVVVVSAGGFDTHSGQADTQQRLLADFAGGVTAFFDAAKAASLDVLLVTTSEFGRRVQENGSGGTDHGAGSVSFAVGPGVKGGVVGTVDLTDLLDGDVRPTVDPRDAVHRVPRLDRRRRGRRAGQALRRGADPGRVTRVVVPSEPGIVTMWVVVIRVASPPPGPAGSPSTGARMSTFDLDLSKYNLGWSDSDIEYAFAPEKGLNKGVVDQIAWWKGEPSWMSKRRQRALQLFERKPMAEWFAVNMPEIDFQDIYYYLRPSAEQTDEWDDLPEQMKATYEKLGIPEAERKYLAGVTSQYDSEVVYHRNREDLEKRGILFCDMDTALREYPDLVKQYFGTVIPAGDNKFAALNTAVWSGGSFIYVPPGVDCEMPLQAYFRINSENAGQFERTLIIADEGSQVHYIEGCSAPVYTNNALHSAVVEIVVKPSARVTYTTIQNWSPNVYNLVTKRARVEAEGHMEWIDGNIGSKLTMKYPSVYLVGPKATGEVLSVAYAGPGQHQDAGAKMIHAAPETTSKIVSKSISKDGGITTYRGLVRGRRGRPPLQEPRAVRRTDPRRAEREQHLPVHGGRRARRADRPRGHGVEDRRRAALLPDEPRAVAGAGDGHGGQRVHRADHPHPADGVRRRVEPSDRAADGGQRRLIGLRGDGRV